MSFVKTVSILGSLAASVSAHGYVQGVVVAGTYYEGYSPSFQYQSPPPDVIGWSDPENLSNGYVAPSAFADPDIICHLDATPGAISAKVAAGDTVELQWTTWPDSHHGPVIDYLAKCSGSCSEVDKTTLEFFKISQGGLIDGSASPGKWASDELIANNNSWAVTIPTGIAAGNYVLRHEIIALHSAGDANGAQNYPQCINLEITSDGTDSPAGTLGTALYKEDDPGILINIYTSLATYTIPGPSLYSGAASAPSQTPVSITSDAPAETGSATSYVAASTTAPASSAAATTSAAQASASSSSYVEATSAPASSAADAKATEASSTYVESAGAAVTVTSECTTTIVATVTAYDGETSAAANSVAPSATAAPESAIASLISAVPSEALTSTIPTTIVPTGTASAASPTGYSSGETQWGSKPSKPLSAGWTLKDLLEWVAYLMKQSWSGKRNHARDFSVDEDTAAIYGEYEPPALPYIP
ncbi:Endoglucanase-4 [Pseudocercospora fuligena]|uniref:Endoglucanase-4 n=1 Tax=Pseudocercospora fuligena TaxID=685502 RepID=A0A8H6VN64_9PEZI|nr:Endoglucanase-4 [Pseudocercospora fuligena]